LNEEIEQEKKSDIKTGWIFMGFLSTEMLSEKRHLFFSPRGDRSDHSSMVITGQDQLG
jgi:hypothetical protein